MLHQPDSFSVLKETFKGKRFLQRRYWALVIGSPRHPNGSISAPLAKVSYTFAWRMLSFELLN